MLDTMADLTIATVVVLSVMVLSNIQLVVKADIPIGRRIHC